MTKEEVYREIKQQIKIVEYASRMGFTVVRKGRYYSLKEHDSVIIDPFKNCFWRNSKAGNGSSIGKGGSIIDFVLEFSGKTLHEVLKDLSAEVYGSGLPRFEKKHTQEKKKPAGTLNLPQSDTHMHNVYAYLIKTRKIDPACVQMLVDRKQLYQDTNRNCVFVSYDLQDTEKPVFACRRGTNTYKPFYGDIEGCDYDQCFYIQNHADVLYITESVIDALSVITLRPQETRNYLALAGVGKTASVERYLQEDIKKIYIGTDNDRGGIAAANELEGIIRGRRPDIVIVRDLPPDPYKDWNEYLQKGGRNT